MFIYDKQLRYKSYGHIIYDVPFYKHFYKQEVHIECVHLSRYGKLKGGQNQFEQSVHLNSSIWKTFIILLII